MTYISDKEFHLNENIFIFVDSPLFSLARPSPAKKEST